MTTDSEIKTFGKGTGTNEIDALVRQMQKAAEEADHEIDGGDLSELTFPQPIFVGRTPFWDEDVLEQWDRERARPGRPVTADS